MPASRYIKPQPTSGWKKLWQEHLWGPKRVFYLLGIITLLALAVFAFSQWVAKPASPSQNAWTACTMFIARQIGISANGAQAYDPSIVRLLSDGSYQVDLAYEKNNIAYTCTTKTLPDGTWQLLGLKVK